MNWPGEIGEWIRTFVRRHTGIVIVLISALGLGIMAGALLAAAVDGADRIALGRDVQSLVAGAQQSMTFRELLATSLPRYVGMAGWLWLLGVTLVGMVGVPALVFWRGLVTGFGMGLLIDLLGWPGLLLSAAVIVPQNIIALVALMLGGTASVSFSLGLWQRRFQHFPGQLLRFTGAMAAVATVLLLAACIEAAAGSIVTKWVASLL